MSKENDIATKEFKIKRYHSNEIKLILFICATKLNNYDTDDLKIFAECIEGRIEVLFESQFLKSIETFIKVNNKEIEKLKNLKTNIQELYSSQWFTKMNSNNWTDIIEKSNEILEQIGIEYQEPLSFMENSLVVDWT